MLPLHGLLYSEESLRNCKRQTLNMQMLLLCSSQQPPLSPIPLSSMWVKEEVIAMQIGEGAILERVMAGAEDSAGPCQTPL